ncbi:hypothetical protein SD80_008850 [Scytonema tolypothrichoides VB-61278]|nr:hypothetical protein SD80_008850 [Scytonema tolypothrichoides VB-61278]
MQGILDGHINIPNVEFVSTPPKPCKKVGGSQKSHLLRFCLKNSSSMFYLTFALGADTRAILCSLPRIICPPF